MARAYAPTPSSNLTNVSREHKCVEDHDFIDMEGNLSDLFSILSRVWYPYNDIYYLTIPRSIMICPLAGYFASVNRLGLFK